MECNDIEKKLRKSKVNIVDNIKQLKIDDEDLWIIQNLYRHQIVNVRIGRNLFEDMEIHLRMRQGYTMPS